MANLPSCSDYSAAIAEPKLIKTAILQGGNPVEKNGRQIKYTGGFCIVFPFQTQSKKYAVRFWHVNVDEAKLRSRLISEELLRLKLPYFVGFEYVENGIATSQGVQPLVVMDWVDAQPLKKYLAQKLNSPSEIDRLAENFKKMVTDLHSHNLSHGDLQHGNLMVKDTGEIVLVDYDSMYVHTLDGKTDDIKGLYGFQHEARWKNKLLTPKADYFSELVIYTSIKALAKNPKLWDELNMEETDTLLFSAEDIKSKGTSSIFKKLELDSDLKPLSEKLIDFTKCLSIDDLEPLEKATTSIIDLISKRWIDNGYRKKTIDYKKLTNDITEKWRKI